MRRIHEIEDTLYRNAAQALCCFISRPTADVIHGLCGIVVGRNSWLPPISHSPKCKSQTRIDLPLKPLDKSLADLSKHNKDDDQEEQKCKTDPGLSQTQQVPKLEGQMKNFTFPLIGGDVATLQVPHPMSDENYNVLMAVLGAIKISLTGKPAPNDSGLPKNQ